MIALERKITVPPDRRVSLQWDFEVPETVPAGETRVVLTFPEPESLEEPEIIPNVEAMAAAKKYIKKYKAAFKALAK